MDGFEENCIKLDLNFTRCLGEARPMLHISAASSIFWTCVGLWEFSVSKSRWHFLCLDVHVLWYVIIIISMNLVMDFLVVTLISKDPGCRLGIVLEVTLPMWSLRIELWENTNLWLKLRVRHRLQAWTDSCALTNMLTLQLCQTVLKTLLCNLQHFVIACFSDSGMAAVIFKGCTINAVGVFVTWQSVCKVCIDC